MNSNVERIREQFMSNETNTDKRFDLAVIGGGPGGYLAAERASQAGHRVVLFEQRRLGGHARFAHYDRVYSQQLGTA
jgi:phytoene dehydrogenase-like protein